MKSPATRFKSMAIALKEIEPAIRNGKHLQTGRPFENFGGMRSREILANWLICAAINAGYEAKFTFQSDSTGGDGIIVDVETSCHWPTEHIVVPRLRPGQTSDAHSLILEAIRRKCRKGGAPYAAGKMLVVFMDAGAGQWFPNRVARELPKPLHFDGVWVVGLHRVVAGQYDYGVTHLDLGSGNAPTLLVRIKKDFTAWEVMRIQ